jgi:hypothetical protein
MDRSLCCYCLFGRQSQFHNLLSWYDTTRWAVEHEKAGTLWDCSSSSLLPFLILPRLHLTLTLTVQP